jgi:hypothetical protein
MIYNNTSELPGMADRLDREAAAILAAWPVTYKDAERAAAKKEMAKDLRAQYNYLQGRGFGGFQPSESRC